MSKTMTRFLSLLLIAVLMNVAMPKFKQMAAAAREKRQSPTKSSWKTMSSSIRTRAS